jgi:hypothetical protein
MEIDVDGLIGAGRHERTGERTTNRNGLRQKGLLPAIDPNVHGRAAICRRLVLVWLFPPVSPGCRLSRRLRACPGPAGRRYGPFVLPLGGGDRNHSHTNHEPAKPRHFLFARYAPNQWCSMIRRIVVADASAIKPRKRTAHSVPAGSE